MKMPNKLCLICQKSIWKPHYKFDIYYLLRCVSCGFIILHPQPSQKELQSLYTLDYFSLHLHDQMPNTIEEIERQIIHRYHFVEWLEQIINKKQRGKLLEIGCATGFLMKAFERRGWQTRGIEFSEDASAYARDMLHLDVSTGSVTRNTLAKSIFDGIIMLHTFEHLPDPDDTLSILYDHLRDGGFIVIQVPNAGSLEARWRGHRWEGWRVPFHFYHFSASTLTRLLKRYGYRINKREYSLPAFETSFIRKFNKRNAHNQQSSEVQVVYKNPAFILQKELLKLLKNLPIGRDMTIVAVKA